MLVDDSCPVKYLRILKLLLSGYEGFVLVIRLYMDSTKNVATLVLICTLAQS